MMPSFCKVCWMAAWTCFSTALGSEVSCAEVVFCNTPDTADSICVRSVARDVPLEPLVAEDKLAAVEVAEPLELPAPPSASKAIKSKALEELLALVLLVCEALLAALLVLPNVLELLAASC